MIVEILWLTTAFLFGAAVGSFLNVCIARLPQEKSIFWPGSRCFTCLQPIRKRDNVPILGYLRLRGKCRTCGARFSSRYMWVELATGLAFVGIFYLDILQNWHGIKYVENQSANIFFGEISLRCWLIFLHHAVFFSFLMAAAMCDIDGMIIPLSITIPGVVVGVVGGAFLGWPWPNYEFQLDPNYKLLADKDWFDAQTLGRIPAGLYPWPVWGPLPGWLPLGSFGLSFATALAGAVVGSLMTRAIKFLFEKGMGREALGLGDADLMMLAGAFMGWQPVVIGFFAGTFVTLIVAVPLVILTGKRHSPFGPGLAIGFLITLYCWKWIGPAVQPFLFDPLVILFVGGFMAVGMFGISFLLRALPAPADPSPAAKG